MRVFDLMVGFVLESSSRFSAEQTESLDKFSGPIACNFLWFFENSTKLANKSQFYIINRDRIFFSAIIRSGWHG